MVEHGVTSDKNVLSSGVVDPSSNMCLDDYALCGCCVLSECRCPEFHFVTKSAFCVPAGPGAPK